MAIYTQLTAIWSGAPGLPGYTRLKFLGGLDATSALAAATRMRAFFESIKALLPQAVSVQVQGVATLHDIDGVLESEVAFAAPAVVQGTSVSGYSAASGAVIGWNTGGINAGRRVRGRTYIVPLSAGTLQNDGTLATVALASLDSAAAALWAGSPSLCIVAGLGTASTSVDAVVSHTIHDRVAILRSRRD